MTSPGHARMTASKNEFAARMAAKPLPESLNSDPDHRFFHDPPELIQIAFGGRPWFLETGCTAPHRVGLFKGLGWAIPSIVAAQDERGITHVRVTARHRRQSEAQLYDIEFLSREVPEDHLLRYTERTVAHRPGLTADQLKAAYAAELGEHAI